MATERNDTDPIAELRQALNGSYHIVRELGRGGMAIVYLAQDVALGRKVAIKLLRPDVAGDPTLRAWFLKEARIAAQLSHPHMVPVYTVADAGEFVYFAMAYVKGDTLARRVRTYGPLPVNEAMRVVREIAGAVAYAHDHGIVHCDLKAENIILERETDRAVLLDLGVAQVLADAPSVTRSSYVVGTPRYMSPEHAQGMPVDERSDVYSLGVVAYFAATGTLPFSGTLQEVFEQHVRSVAPALNLGDRPVDDRFAETVEICLAKRPDDRFQSAGALAQALSERRELPVRLRVFVRHLRSTAYKALGVAEVLALIYLAGSIGTGQWSQAAVSGAIVILLGGAGLALLVGPTRRVLQAGYDRLDIVDAVYDDGEREIEERVLAFGARAGMVERVSRVILYGGLGLVGFGVAAALIGIAGASVVVGSMAIGTVAAVGGGLMTMVNDDRRHDRAAGFWRAFWMSPVAGWFTRLAGIGLRAQPVEESVQDHDMHELSQEMDSIFDGLPPDVRKRLDALQIVLQRLATEDGDPRELLAMVEDEVSGGDDAPVSSRSGEDSSLPG